MGRGTTFTLYLPTLAAPAASLHDERPTQLPQGSGETLGDLNYRVLTAATAEEAIDVHAAHADEVEIVLTDLVMPGAGGIGLVRELRSRDPHVPVVMMTGYGGGSRGDEVPGIAAWVQKPATPRALGVVLREALTHSV